MSREIGIRVDGKRSKHEPWYECAIGGERRSESETIIETLPTNKAFGMRVCLFHRDEPSYQDHEFWRKPRVPKNYYDGN
jgi:hypothetical protein